jgi:murein DD-endopeptidase MepM/ murein hydrolase activator NlpD
LTLTNSVHNNAGQESAFAARFKGKRVERVERGLYRVSNSNVRGPDGPAALSFGQALPAPVRHFGARGLSQDNRTDFGESWPERLRRLIDENDLVPDLGYDFGSLTWWRGLAICTALCTAAWAVKPPLAALPLSPVAAQDPRSWEETRAQSINPLAWGGDTGKRMAANDLVLPLGEAPERPTLDLTATLGQGDGFNRVLERAGVSSGEARRISALVANQVPLDKIAPGTVMQMTLGRRDRKTDPRPLDLLRFRAALDLALTIRRVGGVTLVEPQRIAVNRTPMRVQGLVGESLYRSARAAGVPASAAAQYIKAIASKLSLGSDIDASSKFDLVVEQARAETGEVEFGKLLYAGLQRGSRSTQLLEWNIGGRTEWFEASGVGERRGGMTSPVAGSRVSSGFGMRFHPILRYARMHRGVDFAASSGTPIRAVTDGLVNFAGRKGGNGNFVKLAHPGNLASSYSHLSRIAVSPGTRVLQGQVIGYVGSTGLSTGPHLHFEVYRGGQVVNPRSVSFQSSALLEGQALAAFKSKLANLISLPVAGQ